MNFSIDQLHILTNGGTVTEGSNIYFTLPYHNNAKMLYTTRLNDYTARHDAAGILCNGEVYHITEDLKTSLKDAITSYVYNNFSLELAKKAYQEQPEARRWDLHTNIDVSHQVDQIFYNDEVPTFKLFCKYHFDFNNSTLIDFIIDQDTTVKNIATDLLKRHPEDIINSFNSFYAIKKAYDELIKDPANPRHQAKEIIKSITDQKTVHVILHDGRDIKVEALATRGIRYNFTISNYYVIDRHLLETDQYGHSKDIKMSDIKAIKYKNKELYTA